ncbi:MAG: SufD family Fe-S cluster assembly protein [Anaerorhabdus sp.]
METIIVENFHKVIVDSNEASFNFICDNKADIYIEIQSCAKLNINLTVKNSALCNLFILNESQSDISINECYDVLSDAKLNMAYVDCDNQKSTRNCVVSLLKENASANIKSAILAQFVKSNTIKCISYFSNTSGIMENYGVVAENGTYSMEATGNITKGSFNSTSHQTSRALTIGENSNTIITPILLIDENDVQASHATSIGQVDENQLVYLQSRGLTKSQILALITRGYLIPIASFFDDEKLNDFLVEKIENKVNKVCLI